MKHNLVLRMIAKLFIPFILLFALYVQFHGDFGPGGGFQAGVILAAAIVFYALIYGMDRTRKVMPDWVVPPVMVVRSAASVEACPWTTSSPCSVTSLADTVEVSAVLEVSAEAVEHNNNAVTVVRTCVSR